MSTSSLSAAALDLDALLGPDVHRSPDMEAVWQWLVDQDGHVPDWTRLPAAEARALQDQLNARWNVDLPSIAAAERIVLSGDVPVAAEMIVPLDAKPGCILFLHGGGWAFGNLSTYARFTRALAAETGTRVLAPAYRLAPEHPFPAPFDDSVSAWQALAGMSGQPGFDGPLAIAGDSAGANLALAVTLHMTTTGGRRPDCGLLFYGAFEAGTESPSYDRFAEGFGLTRAGMARFWDWYVPPGSAARRDPRVSPLRASEADIARLPPLFLNAAGLDPLLCDTVAMARRIEAAGVTHHLDIADGLHHGFMQMGLRLPAARDAIRQAATFFAEHARDR